MRARVWVKKLRDFQEFSPFRDFQEFSPCDSLPGWGATNEDGRIGKGRERCRGSYLHIDSDLGQRLDNRLSEGLEGTKAIHEIHWELSRREPDPLLVPALEEVRVHIPGLGFRV